jgi:hypothetical protein
MKEDELANFATFRDCLATPLIEKSAEKPRKSRKSRANAGRKTAIKPVASAEEINDAEELAEFIDVATVLIPIG